MLQILQFPPFFFFYFLSILHDYYTFYRWQKELDDSVDREIETNRKLNLIMLENKNEKLKREKLQHEIEKNEKKNVELKAVILLKSDKDNESVNEIAALKWNNVILIAKYDRQLKEMSDAFNEVKLNENKLLLKI
jgi:hypothetical protein